MNKQTIITILLFLVTVAGISNAFDFSIDDEDVTIAVNKDVAGNDIPDEKTAVGIATNRIHAVEANGGHVGVDGYLRRGLGILYKILLQNGHNSSTVKPREGVKLIERVWEYGVVHPNFVEETEDTAAVQKIIDFVDDVIGNVGVILVTAWTRCPQVEHIIHRYPQPVFLSKCFGNTLLDFKGAYMWLAISTLRFI